MATAIPDNAGVIEIRGQKLSKPGVFQYLGSEIGAPMPDKIYNVLRRPESLANPDTIESFKLKPWVITHDMLGKKYSKPAEEKGIHGVIGQDVYYDESDGWLKGNVKLFSDTLEEAITLEEIDELSLGFGCKYDFSKTGVYDGQHYNVEQSSIRGNHLASVEESRMEVAVMDEASCSYAQDCKMTFKPDTERAQAMSTEKQPGSGQDEEMKKGSGEDMPEKKEGMDEEMSMGDLMAKLDEMLPVVAKMQEFMGKMGGMMEGKHEGMDEEKEEGEGMDSAKAITATMGKLADTIAKVNERLDTIENKVSGMDSASLLQAVASRDALVEKLTPFTGAFDHSAMTLQQVQEYGVEKLDLKCEKGHEGVALDAALQVMRPAHADLVSNHSAAPAQKGDAAVSDILGGK